MLPDTLPVKPGINSSFVAMTPTLVWISYATFSATGLITSITGTLPATNSNTSFKALAVAVLQAITIALQFCSSKSW